MPLLADDITAKAGTNGDRGHVAGTRRRSRGLVQVRGPNTIITVEVAVRAGWFKKEKQQQFVFVTCPHIFCPLHLFPVIS